MPRKKNTVMGFSADRLNNLIKKDNLSNKQICDKLGINRIATVSEWRNGKKEPSSKHLEELCRLFKVETAYFYPGIADSVAEAYEKGRKFAADLHYDDVLRNADLNTQIEQDLLMIDRPQIVFLAHFFRANGYEVNYYIRKKGKSSSSSSVAEKQYKAATILKSVQKRQISELKGRLLDKEYERIQIELIELNKESPYSINNMEKLKIYKLQILYNDILDRLKGRQDREEDVIQGVYERLLNNRGKLMQYQYEIKIALDELRHDKNGDWKRARDQYKKLSNADPHKEIRKYVVWKKETELVQKEYNKITDYWNEEPFDWERYDLEYPDEEARSICDHIEQLMAEQKANDISLQSLGKLLTEAAASYNEISDFREMLEELRSGERYEDEIYNQFDILVCVMKDDVMISKVPLEVFEVYTNTVTKQIEADLRDISME